MNDKKLSQYARENELSYMKAYRLFQAGAINGAYKTATGSIFIKDSNSEKLVENSAPLTVNSISSINAENKTLIPALKYENISMASDTSTRKNKAADSEIINRFANIDAGIVPYVSSTGGGFNKSGITVRDCIVLCQKAYFNIAVMRQIIDLIVDLSIGQIFFKGGNKKSREFFEAYCRKIGISTSFQEQYFLELWRSSNVLAYAYKKDINTEDVKKITQVYGIGVNASIAKKKVTLPVRFTILNPADVQVGTYSMFITPTYYKILNGYELERLKNPKNDTDKEVLESLPKETQDAIKDRKTQVITIQLDTENVLPSFYKKMDYEGLALPVFFPVLDDLNWKLQLKKMDMATTRMMNQAILLITTGAEPEKGGINPQNITNLQTIFQNESVGRVLIADYTTKADFIIPSIADILDPKKYEVVNNDIYIGLNYVLLQGEKFANKQTALQLFIEKINYGRKLFIHEFLNKVIESVSKELGFKNYPEAYFEEIKISDKTERDRIITQLTQYGQLTPKEVFEALDNGRMPLAEESVENQEEYAAQKKKGLYQPITGGPTSQMDLLKETGKQANQTQDKQFEHDAKESSKQRKHDAENPPPAPPPAIHIGTPTKSLKKPNGRPSGSKRPQSTKRVKPAKAELISGSKVIENTLLLDKLNHKVKDFLMEKYSLKSLNELQLSLSEELSDIIIRNEEPKNWLSSIETYHDLKADKNLDRVRDIEELAYEYQLKESHASIVYASIKEAEDTSDLQTETAEISLIEDEI